MKRILLLIMAVLSLPLGTYATPVGLETAKAVAAKFMGTADLTLTATYLTSRDEAALYVFNTGDGFVIVAADDCETPVVGYSREGRFDPRNVPVQMEDCLSGFVAGIEYAIRHGLSADGATAGQWEAAKATGRIFGNKPGKAVEPLLTERWSQGCLYNSACPAFDGAPCGHARTGCVATAMAQLMHHWRYPATGWGSFTYSDGGTTYTADFGGTSYEWGLMPDSLTDGSGDNEVAAVATLMWHCGVAVATNYAPDGSNTSIENITGAMVRYFDYSRGLRMEKRSKYTDEEWLSMLKGNLDQGLPVLYSGYGSASHAFVCDGYDANDMLHFNWGWGGNANGYFALGSLNPEGNNFNKRNYAVFDIVPRYEPLQVTATSYPQEAGTVEGAGEYHIGAPCTLTAVPSENCKFHHWKRDGKVVSAKRSYTVDAVESDIDGIEACFSFVQAEQAAAVHHPDPDDPGSPSMALSWSGQDPSEWPLLATIQVDPSHQQVATDGEYIYAFTGGNNYYGIPFECSKYGMDGEFMEQFRMDDGFATHALAFDGTYFYGVQLEIDGESLVCVDLNEKTIVYSARFPLGSQLIDDVCAYDPVNDGFWVSSFLPNCLKFVDRQANVILSYKNNSMYFQGGSCFLTAEDGSPHVLLSDGNKVYDFDIENGFFSDKILHDFHGEHYRGGCTGDYQGKKAIFKMSSNGLEIYEIDCRLSQVTHFHVYRSKSDGETLSLADEVRGYSFVDTSWQGLEAGLYRYGVSAVYGNGVESEPVWTDFVEKQNIGVEEHESPEDPSVQKVFENGMIVIIKDGKRYSITGQQLNSPSDTDGRRCVKKVMKQ